MFVTPGGSIVAIIGNPNKVRKPETDPDWEEHEEERAAARAAKRAATPSAAKRPRKL